MLVLWMRYARRTPLSALLVLLLAVRPARPAPHAPPTRPSPPTIVFLSSTNSTTKSPATSAMLNPSVVLTRSLYVAGFARPHAELCPAHGAHLKLVILVASAPGHASKRRAVRLTWGHAARRSDLAVAFVLGAPPPELRPELDEEDAVYGDLIEGRFLDTYSNLTLKTISMLEWKVMYCPRAPFLLKTDDDVFVNVDRLLRFAAVLARRNATNAVWGSVTRRAKPIRVRLHKYYAPPEQYPVVVYPNYAQGPAYLVAADAARQLARAAGAARYLRLEDVFVTGVLAARRGVRRVHVRGFLRLHAARHPCEVRRWLAAHMVLYHQQFELWYKTLADKFDCRASRLVSST